MTKDEALKLALEALENVTEDYVKDRQYKHNKAITAIKEALEPPKTFEEAYASMKWEHIFPATDTHHQSKERNMSKEILRPQNKPAPVQQEQNEFILRGMLATLLCWHRLTQAEQEDLLRFAAAQPAYRAVKTFHEGNPVYVAQHDEDDDTQGFMPDWANFQEGRAVGWTEAIERIAEKVKEMPWENDTKNSFLIWLKEQR
jgi:hypothetical protein